MKAVLIDNYDSFTYNLKVQIEQFGAEVDVIRNDKVSMTQLEGYDFMVFSPGPSLPDQAGDLLKIIRHFRDQKPMLGICLGMQAIGEVFGCKLKLLQQPLHGISKMVTHFGDPIFQDIHTYFEAGRYHSWVIDKEHVSDEIKILAVSVEKELMAVKHASLPIYGFQFHPESILTEVGDQLIRNFIQQVKNMKNEAVIKQTI